MAETRTISARKGNSADSEPPAKPQRTRITKRKANENHARSYFEAIARRDVDNVLAHWSEEGVIDLVPLTILRGRAQIGGFFREMFAAFPDLDMTITRIAAGQSEVAVEWRITATFTGEPFQGIEATGRPIELRGIDMIEIEDRLNVSNTAFYDGMAFARAVGMLPAQDSGAERAMKGAVNAVTKARRAYADLRYRTAA